MEDNYITAQLSCGIQLQCSASSLNSITHIINYTTMKYQFNYSDSNYASAINYDGTDYYNNPITIDIDGKLFVLGIGNADYKEVKIDGNYLYIVAENKPLDYISLTIIDVSDNSVQSAYLSGNDINDPQVYSYGIMDKDTDEQIKILSEYL